MGTTLIDRLWNRWQMKRQQKRVMAAMQSVKLSVVALNQAMTQAGLGSRRPEKV